MVSRISISNRNKKIKIKMNNPVYLGFSILKISKTLMYELWYDYIKSKYCKNEKICYMDTDSFIMHIKIEDLNEDIEMMLKKDLTHQILKSIDHYQKVKIKK